MKWIKKYSGEITIVAFFGMLMVGLLFYKSEYEQFMATPITEISVGQFIVLMCLYLFLKRTPKK